ncbi:uncharacterized protein LOC129608100 [Condylostylus longicornis]|uniref:uncharacterized protein LOC129608100 n=1 Tax=Condylostylus longicornis TaxID=2530218 RepID=UPI00244E171B|nr:uncharacterized protein LOC129608100 [Condylostylus longicornis]
MNNREGITRKTILPLKNQETSRQHQLRQSVQNLMSGFVNGLSNTVQGLQVTAQRLQTTYSQISNVVTNRVNATTSAVGERLPCECDKGICKCCTGRALLAIGLRGCMEVVYFPEDFAFELKMKMNDITLYRNKVSGKNPPPMCFRPPRFYYIRACITLYDIYFIGQNMHVCMDIGGYFEGYEVFSRSFDCLMFGDKGVKIVKPEEGYPIRPTDVDIYDEDDEEIEDYDENILRSLTTVK